MGIGDWAFMSTHDIKLKSDPIVNIWTFILTDLYHNTLCNNFYHSDVSIQ